MCVFLVCHRSPVLQAPRLWRQLQHAAPPALLQRQRRLQAQIRQSGPSHRGRGGCGDADGPAAGGQGERGGFTSHHEEGPSV